MSKLQYPKQEFLSLIKLDKDFEIIIPQDLKKKELLIPLDCM